MQAVSFISLPTSTTAGSANSTYAETAPLPANGHFEIGATSLARLLAFGGNFNLPAFHATTQTATFTLDVDDVRTDAKTITYSYR